jgi:hypothetical protein
MEMDTFSPGEYCNWPLFIHNYPIINGCIFAKFKNIAIISVCYIIVNKIWHMTCVTICKI